MSACIICHSMSQYERTASHSFSVTARKSYNICSGKFTWHFFCSKQVPYNDQILLLMEYSADVSHKFKIAIFVYNSTMSLAYFFKTVLTFFNTFTHVPYSICDIISFMVKLNFCWVTKSFGSYWYSWCSNVVKQAPWKMHEKKFKLPVNFRKNFVPLLKCTAVLPKLRSNCLGEIFMGTSKRTKEFIMYFLARLNHSQWTTPWFGVLMWLWVGENN